MDSDPDRPVLAAAKLLAYKRARGLLPTVQPPHSIIFIFQSSILKAAFRRHPVHQVNGFAGQLHLLKRTKDRVGILSSFGMGAPVTGALIDELAAWGVKRFIGVGLAGGLQSVLHAGDLVLCRRSKRDEGTSQHYDAAGDWVEATAGLIETWGVGLRNGRHAFTIGDGWTTDAPYRELRRDVLAYAEAGVQTVDMEASALMAVAKFYGCEAACGFAVADSLANGEWVMGDMKLAERSLNVLLDSAVAILVQSE